MKIVLDTNVLVSGLLKPSGPPGMIVQMAVSGKFRLCYDARILIEYRAVLARPKFGFDPAGCAQLLASLETKGMACSSLPLKKHLPDKTDEAFLEVAMAAKADFLVTGNKKDFSPAEPGEVRIVSPAEFLEAW